MVQERPEKPANELQNKDIMPEIVLSDFSEQVYSVQVKFVTVALISVFVSVFQLDKKSAIFGLRVTDLSERVLEFGFFSVASLLGILYLMRISEEREVFFDITKNLSQLEKKFSNSLGNLLNTKKVLEQDIINNPLLSKSFVGENVRGKKKTIDDLIKLLEIELDVDDKTITDQDRRKTLSEVKLVATEVSQQLNGMNVDWNNLVKFMNNWFERWDKRFLTIEDFPLTSRFKKKLVSKRRIRILFFDFILPVTLSLLVLVTFFFPDQCRDVLQEIFDTQSLGKTELRENAFLIIIKSYQYANL